MLNFNEIDLDLLKRLSEADGIGGREREVSRIVTAYGKEYSDEIQYDNLGSVVLKSTGKSKTSGPKIMLSSHMDEVGFMVRSITDDGYVNLLPVGGWWGHVMPAQEMTITTINDEKFIGIVGSRAPHGLSSEIKERVIPPMDLYLDLGMPSRESVEQLGISIGDMITPHVHFREMNDPNYLMGKAWDDRCCVGVGLEVLKNMNQSDYEADIYFAATTQEEVGIRGARTAVHTIKPDVAIALDVTTATDTPFDKKGMALGEGVVLSVLDSLTIGNNGLVQMMEEIVNDLSLDVRFDFMTVGGTDACNIHKMMDGVVSMTLSIPTRYMHSPRLIIHKEDYIQTIKLVTEFCRRLNWDRLNQMKSSVGITMD
ncbi:M42 family metallopeptidase [Candidatus Enterococcus murrayae]|uniref:M42 family metallopeptidase n=1 Tax=Candidatus Enterococcus murrayae TaxID=2815321 RepID=A0ABS3HEU8_9ENTE|nr:M42 family metallopeptidase [Enterococcus sp. MJM16]MBO0451484.1 M42 family metallopeptidase [Enterococcus sp. MJM16]